MAVELVVGVLPDAAGVEHHHVGRLHVVGRHQAVGHQRARPVARSRARSSGTRTSGCGRSAAGPRRRRRRRWRARSRRFPRRCSRRTRIRLRVTCPRIEGCGASPKARLAADRVRPLPERAPARPRSARLRLRLRTTAAPTQERVRSVVPHGSERGPKELLAGHQLRLRAVRPAERTTPRLRQARHAVGAQEEVQDPGAVAVRVRGGEMRMSTPSVKRRFWSSSSLQTTPTPQRAASTHEPVGNPSQAPGRTRYGRFGDRTGSMPRAMRWNRSVTRAPWKVNRWPRSPSGTSSARSPPTTCARRGTPASLRRRHTGHLETVEGLPTKCISRRIHEDVRLDRHNGSTEQSIRWVARGGEGA